MDKPQVFEGGIGIDDRGFISYCNDFNFNGVKRFYQVSNYNNDIIRAFHGHNNEEKYVFVPKGSIMVLIVPIEELINKTYRKVYKYILSSMKPSVLYIPRGYANGFRTLEDNTIIQFYSTSTLEDSLDDDIRFSPMILGKEIWLTENR